MAKIVSFIVLAGLVLAAVAAVNTSAVNAREETRFVPISVLAEGQANYGLDENLTIPAISPAIIEDKVHDTLSESLVPTFTYSPLPEDNSEPVLPSEEEIFNDHVKDAKEQKDKDAKEALKEEEKEEKEALKEEEKEEKEEEKKEKKETKEEKKETKDAKEPKDDIRPPKDDKDNKTK
jgi:hypothetical protein